jgi:site-specific DNA recombinase
MGHMQTFTDTLVAQKAVLLSRVSSKDQEEGFSIDAQRHRLENYCLRKGMEIIKVFEITESSTVGERKKFMNMVNYASTQKETIAIVADKVDRIQRSFKEYSLLDGLIQQGKIELHFCTENYVIHKKATSHERVMWSMGVVMAQSYIDSMKDNVKRSFDQKIRMGEWIAQAPVGYLNVKDANGKSDVIRDESRAPLIERLFREYATGAFTVGDMVEKGKQWGLTSKSGNKSHIGKSKMHKLLSNPFYHGQMLIKGELYNHRYPPIITKELFEACRTVMNGWNKKPFKYAGIDFVFRGILTCAVTGRTVSTERQRKKYKNGGVGEWNYVRTWNPENPEKYLWVREEEILSQVEEVFKSLKIPEKTLSRVIDYVRKTDKAEREFLNRQIGDLQREHTKAQTRLDGLMDFLLDGIIGREEFETKRKALRQAQIDAERLIQAHRQGDEGFKDSMLFLLSTASEAHRIFAASTNEEKRVLMNHVFQNLSLNGRKLCYSLKKPFDDFQKCTTLNEWQGRQGSNLRPRVLETHALPAELHPCRRQFFTP